MIDFESLVIFTNVERWAQTASQYLQGILIFTLYYMTGASGTLPPGPASFPGGGVGAPLPYP